MTKYTSSIINKYGDTSKVKEDVKTIRDIINRQGSTLLIDCIAEHTGEVANTYKLNEVDRSEVIKSLVDELKEALSERL